MGNNQTWISVGSCGLLDARKQIDPSTQQVKASRDKSLYIDSLSLDDNRNIKKLYSIMDLARQGQTVQSLVQNLEIAYRKLAEFHDKDQSPSEKRIHKNITKSSQQHIHLKPFSAPVIQNEHDAVIQEEETKHQEYACPCCKAQFVNLTSVQEFSAEFNILVTKVYDILNQELNNVEGHDAQSSQKFVPNNSQGGRSENSIPQEVQFLISMSQFFQLFQNAQNELIQEQKIKIKNGKAITECMNCGISCTSRQKRDQINEDTFCLYRKQIQAKSINKHRKFEEFKDETDYKLEQEYQENQENEMRASLPTFRNSPDEK